MDEELGVKMIGRKRLFHCLVRITVQAYSFVTWCVCFHPRHGVFSTMPRNRSESAFLSQRRIPDFLSNFWIRRKMRAFINYIFLPILSALTRVECLDKLRAVVVLRGNSTVTGVLQLEQRRVNDTASVMDPSNPLHLFGRFDGRPVQTRHFSVTKFPVIFQQASHQVNFHAIVWKQLNVSSNKGWHGIHIHVFGEFCTYNFDSVDWLTDWLRL